MFPGIIALNFLKFCDVPGGTITECTSYLLSILMHFISYFRFKLEHAKMLLITFHFLLHKLKKRKIFHLLSC